MQTLPAPVLATGTTPTSQAITFTLTAAFVTLMTLVLTNRSKRATEANIAQQHRDDLAERQRERAEDAAAAVAKEARDYQRADVITARADRAARRTLRKLGSVERLGKVTHALVNSDKTASLREKLDNLDTTLVLMREVVELKRSNGLEPSAESLAFLATQQQRIASLTTEITERVAEQKAAEAANVDADRAAAQADVDDDLDDDAADAAEAAEAAAAETVPDDGRWIGGRQPPHLTVLPTSERSPR